MFIYLDWGISPLTYEHTKKYRTDSPDQADQYNIPRSRALPQFSVLYFYSCSEPSSLD